MISRWFWIFLLNSFDLLWKNSIKVNSRNSCTATGYTVAIVEFFYTCSISAKILSEYFPHMWIAIHHIVFLIYGRLSKFMIRQRSVIYNPFCSAFTTDNGTKCYFVNGREEWRQLQPQPLKLLHSSTWSASSVGEEIFRIFPSMLFRPKCPQNMFHD